MKFVCQRSDLLHACQVISGALAARDVNPVLRNIKGSVGGERLTLLATDTEVGIRHDVLGVQCEEPGDALWPAARLAAILKEIVDDQLVLETTSEFCHLRGAAAEFEMLNEDPAAYPAFPLFEETQYLDSRDGDVKKRTPRVYYHEVQAGVLKQLLKRVSFAAAEENTARIVATRGVLWELEGDKIRLVATDGRRMAVADGAATAQGEHTTAGRMLVVSIKTMALLDKSLSDPDEKVLIVFRSNEVFFKLNKATIYGRLVDGRFPNYRQVIPQKNTIEVPLVAGTFAQAVRQAAIMTDDESKRVVFNFARDQITLHAKGQGAGRSKVQVPVAYQARPVEISFDPKFLTDMLKVLEKDAKLSLWLHDGGTPALFKVESGDYQYVVVPLVSQSAVAAHKTPVAAGVGADE